MKHQKKGTSERDQASSDEAKILERYEKLKGQEDWCRKHIYGYFGNGPQDPDISAGRIGKKRVQIKGELKRLSPMVKRIKANAGMTVTLSRENARNLLFAAKMVHVEPDRLLNRWLIRDILRDMKAGDLRGLIDAIVYESTEEAACVMRDVIKWEKEMKLPGAGKDFRFPTVKGMKNAKASA